MYCFIVLWQVQFQMTGMFILLFPKVQQSHAFYILLRNNQLHFLCSLLYFSDNCLHKELPHIKLLCVRKWILPVHLETIDPVGWIYGKIKTKKKIHFDKADWANIISQSACWFLTGCHKLQTIGLQIIKAFYSNIYYNSYWEWLCLWQ